VKKPYVIHILSVNKIKGKYNDKKEDILNVFSLSYPVCKAHDHFILSSVAYEALQHSSISSHKQRDYREKDNLT
jgi:hypothetical protein